MKNKSCHVLVAAVPLAFYLVACSKEDLREPSDSGSGTELIAFTRRNIENTISLIHVMSPDGSNIRLLGNGGTLVDHSLAWSPDGRSLAYIGDKPLTDFGSRIYILNSDGVVNKPMKSCTPESVTWSPDGSHIAFDSQHDRGFRIYTTSINNQDVNAITTEVNALWGWDFQPSWSPNGEKIAFTSNRDGSTDIYVMNLDGSEYTRLTESFYEEENPVWSPDGKKIAFDRLGNGNNSWSVFVMNADGSDLFQVTHNLTGAGHYPTWSPDGTRLAFVSDHDGNDEIYVVNIDGTGLKRLTNDPRPDRSPAWSPRPD